jgi:hypothetical protein
MTTLTVNEKKSNSTPPDTPLLWGCATIWA